MAEEKNKVTFGLENVHYAKGVFDETTGDISYEEPKRWRGAVDLTLDPNGDPVNFKADNVDYWENLNNQGYTGTLTSAMVPDDFLVNHLGEVINEDGVQEEVGTAQSTPFALMFQFEGDKKAVRHVMYWCTASRPSIASATEDSGEPNTQALSFNAKRRPSDKKIKAKATTEQTPYAGWFDAVYQSAGTAGAASTNESTEGTE